MSTRLSDKVITDPSVLCLIGVESDTLLVFFYLYSWFSYGEPIRSCCRYAPLKQASRLDCVWIKSARCLPNPNPAEVYLELQTGGKRNVEARAGHAVNDRYLSIFIMQERRWWGCFIASSFFRESQTRIQINIQRFHVHCEKQSFMSTVFFRYRIQFWLQLGVGLNLQSFFNACPGSFN